MDWHHLTAEQVLAELDTDSEQGLSPTEVQARQIKYGLNQLASRPGQPAWVRFLLQFNQPLIFILVLSGVISGFLGEYVDASVILGVTVMNAMIGFLQESRAVAALQSLAKTVTTEASVWRSGQLVRLPAIELVPGDVVQLQSGDKVPADLRLIQSRQLQINESALTGESVPVSKQSTGIHPKAVLAERFNMAYASTFVTMGQGRGVVIATAEETEVGRISQLLAETIALETPLTRHISRFSNLLLYIILAMAALTFMVGMWRGQSAFSMFMAAVALAVGAIPEGLPAAVTITLAIGVNRMASRRAIVRQLPAVETLGGTTVICSDKTGTLTQNQMTVTKLVIGDAVLSVTGHGYEANGQILQDGQPLLGQVPPGLATLLQAGILCNDSQWQGLSDTTWTMQGDPTEVALWVAAAKGIADYSTVTARYPRLDLIPFESEYQYMATLNRGEELPTLNLKGAVEVLLPRCSRQLNLDGSTQPLEPEAVQQTVNRLSLKGLRVLSVVQKPMVLGTTTIESADLDADFIFVGLQAMQDPPRPEAIEAIKHCQEAGIAVKMITGDHAQTALAIGHQLGLIPPETTRVMTGVELAQCNANELRVVASQCAIFARVSPEQKLRLVQALQQEDQVVAMTGDGVNDAPALKQADIGIAMGLNGTDVARDSAAMILTDDNFATIEAAVEEGRCVFDNINKFIVWTLPTNLGQGLLLMWAIFAGVTLPILPVQILWINMTTAVLLGLMLAFEPKEPDLMLRPPRHPKTPLMSTTLISRVIGVGLLLLVGSFGLFEWEMTHGATLAQGRTVAVGVFVMVSFFYLFNCRSFTKSMFALGVLSNRWLLGGCGAMLSLQLAYTYVPFMNTWFASAPIGWGSWIRILSFSVVVFLLIGLEKRWRSKSQL